MYSTRTIPPKKTSKKRLFLGSLLALIVIATVLGTLEATNTTHLFHRAAPAPPSANQSTKGEPTAATRQTDDSSTAAKSQDTSATAVAGDNKTSSGGVTATTLIMPTGNFVSAHKNVPLSAPLSSVCNTSVGANCTITFTLDGVTKSLPVQSTDRGGTAYWNSWTPKSIGLTAGSWDIQAIATLSGQTKTANDALKLEVTQ